MVVSEGVAAEREGLRGLVERVVTAGIAPLGGPHAYDADRAARYRASAVLALFTPTGAAVSERAQVSDAVDLFLVQRSPLLRHHPGQIALPGGRLEEGETDVEAALRETEEEIGLARHHIEVLAELEPVLVPFSRFVVRPVLGWTEAAQEATEIAPGEVLHTLRVPVAQLLDPDRRATVTIHGSRSAGFRLESGWVWGFTGNLLDHLFTALGWTRPWPREREHAMSMDEASGRHLRDR